MKFKELPEKAQKLLVEAIIIEATDEDGASIKLLSDEDIARLGFDMTPGDVKAHLIHYRDFIKRCADDVIFEAVQEVLQDEDL